MALVGSDVEDGMIISERLSGVKEIGRGERR